MRGKLHTVVVLGIFSLTLVNFVLLYNGVRTDYIGQP